MGTEIPGGGLREEVYLTIHCDHQGRGRRGELYLTIHCHHQKHLCSASTTSESLGQVKSVSSVSQGTIAKKHVDSKKQHSLPQFTE